MTKALYRVENCEKKGNFLKNGVADGSKPANLNGTSGHLLDRQAVERWLSTKEAALHLGLSPNALRILVHRGKVRAYKLGARLKFKVKDLQAIIKTKKEML